MMGLFDGATPTGDEGSTAEIAKWLEAPVLLVIDASGMARTIAAVAHGFAISTRAQTRRPHLQPRRQPRPSRPVARGVGRRFRCSADFRARRARLSRASSRALSADEKNVPQPLFDAWADLAAQWLDLDAIVRWRGAAPRLSGRTLRSYGLESRACFAMPNRRRVRRRVSLLLRRQPAPARGGGRRDRAICADARARLPEVDGLYFGGGYPEALAASFPGIAR